MARQTGTMMGLISPLEGEMSALPTEGGVHSPHSHGALVKRGGPAPPSVPSGHLPLKGGDQSAAFSAVNSQHWRRQQTVFA